MNKAKITVLLTFLIFSCNNINHRENTIVKLESLRAENDSLKKIVAEINNKYVFDSVTVRDIPSYKNSYEMNSILNGEIVFVGYNNNIHKNTNVIVVDSVSYNPKKLYKPDTLDMENGGFHYEKKINAKRIYWKAVIETKHKYGKKFEGILSNAAQVKKD